MWQSGDCWAGVWALKIKVDFSSISVQLIALVLIITIVPIGALTYINDQRLTSAMNDQLKTKVNDVTIIIHMAYQDRMEGDNSATVRLSEDPRLITAINAGNRSWVKAIVDEYSRPEKNVNYIITVADRNGTVLARSATNESGDITANTRLFMALGGNGSSVTDILPEQVIINNGLWDQVSATGMTEGLAIVNTQPVRDDRSIIIGAVSISNVLNNNNDIVDLITAQTQANCTIFQNDTRIATTLRDPSGGRIVGTKALPQVIEAVLYNKSVVNGIYNINNMTMYTHYEPLINDRGDAVGMLFAGIDAGPSQGQLNGARLQAILAAVIASVVFAALGYLLVQTITRPIKRIVKTANNIAAGDLDTPVDTEASGGEIGELSAAIKQMVGYMVTNLKEGMNFNDSIVKGIADPMLVVGRDGRITFFNEVASALTGYRAGEALGQDYAQLLQAPEDGGIRSSIGSQKAVRGFEDVIQLKNGSRATVRGSSAPLKDASGEVIGAIVLLHDMTREKEADEKIKAQLREKEVLLKEIHHRVKNNLQIISSLLSLQSMYIKDKQALGMFKESQNRVKSMALIHEKLYQSKDIARIDFAEYIRNLVGNLIRSYNASPAMVRLNIDADNVSLGIDTAIPCGLIINELVTNSLKYAFPDGRKGEIRVGLRSGIDGDPGKYRLVVADNGVGLPESIEVGKTGTLGMQLVSTLIEQLNGTVVVGREGGTEFVITFSEIRAREQQAD